MLVVLSTCPHIGIWENCTIEIVHLYNYIWRELDHNRGNLLNHDNISYLPKELLCKNK